MPNRDTKHTQAKGPPSTPPTNGQAAHGGENGQELPNGSHSVKPDSMVLPPLKLKVSAHAPPPLPPLREAPNKMESDTQAGGVPGREAKKGEVPFPSIPPVAPAVPKPTPEPVPTEVTPQAGISPIDDSWIPAIELVESELEEVGVSPESETGTSEKPSEITETTDGYEQARSPTAGVEWVDIRTMETESAAPKRASRWSAVVLVLVGLFLGAAVGYLASRYVIADRIQSPVAIEAETLQAVANESEPAIESSTIPAQSVTELGADTSSATRADATGESMPDRSSESVSEDQAVTTAPMQMVPGASVSTESPTDSLVETGTDTVALPVPDELVALMPETISALVAEGSATESAIAGAPPGEGATAEAIPDALLELMPQSLSAMVAEGSAAEPEAETPPAIPATALAAPPTEAYPSAQFEVEPSHPLLFDGSLWRPGNTWIYRYRRIVPEDATEFMNLEFYFRREVTEVTPHPWGLQVVVTDEGGIEGPRTREYVATASCLFEARREDVVFCLPPDENQLQARILSDTTAAVVEVADGETSMAFDPRLGWISEMERDRDGEQTEARLVGFRVGDRVGGELDRPIYMCDWTGVFEEGQRIGHVDRSRTDEIRRCSQWGLTRAVERWDIPLSGSHGLSRLTAWNDASQTLYMISEVPPTQGEAPGRDQPVEQVDMPLNRVKTWQASDGSAEYVALLFEKEAEATVRLLRISGEGQVETHTLLPPGDERSLMVVLLASDSGCYVQVRNGYGANQQFGNFALTPEGVQHIAGELGRPSE